MVWDRPLQMAIRAQRLPQLVRFARQVADARTAALTALKAFCAIPKPMKSGSSFKDLTVYLLLVMLAQLGAAVASASDSTSIRTSCWLAMNPDGPALAQTTNSPSMPNGCSSGSTSHPVKNLLDICFQGGARLKRCICWP